jgi:hypothetical protein
LHIRGIVSVVLRLRRSSNGHNEWVTTGNNIGVEEIWSHSTGFDKVAHSGIWLLGVNVGIKMGWVTRGSYMVAVVVSFTFRSLA